jgi:hypothetical protein
VTIHPRSPSPPQPATEASLAELRDQLLGPLRPGEDPESYRLRAYQARAQAAELLGAEKAPDPDQDPSQKTDPTSAPSHDALAAISETLAGADRSWTEVTDPPPP